MTASDYQVEFGYGAIDNQFYGPNGSIGPYHRGEDRFTPTGTPVLVNGVQIGLTGATGAVSGPHLHIGHWKGAQDIPPGGGGFTVSGGYVSEVSYDKTNGNFVRIQDQDGTNWVYLHLSRIDVTQGQKLEGEDMAKVQVLNDGLNRIRYGVGLPAQPDNSNVDDILARSQLVYGDADNIIKDLLGRNASQEDYQALEKGPKEFLYYVEDLAKAQRDDLQHKVNVVQASNGDATRWQTLKTLLKELLS